MENTLMPTRVIRWSQKLLDLTLRNRLLNVRDIKQVIPLVCRDISLIEDRLTENAEIPLSFGDPAKELLVSGCTKEETAKRLKLLYRLARTDLEESGVNTLFLALGFLRWKPSGAGTRTYRAPLILVPVKLVRKSLTDIRLARHDDETMVNATLIELLRTEFHIPVTGLDPLPTDAHGIDITAVLESFHKAVADQDGWEVIREAALGQFSFGKFVMWKDLVSRLDILRRHPLVNHLIEGRGDFDDGVAVFPPEEIASHLDIKNLYCPLSADASQLTAVLYSQLGKTFVLHGPPGTGKSQTITNLIAQNLAHGRRVLFVSEKKAALDVVHNRLAKIGLRPFCLELHSNKSGKAEVLAQFAEALNSPARLPTPDQVENAKNLDAERQTLNAYVQALHRKYPNGLSAYDCLGQSIRRSEDDPPRELIDADTLHQSAEDMSAARETAARIATDFAAAGSETVKALAPLKPGDWTPDAERRLATAAEDIRSAVARGFFGKLLAAFKHRGHIDFAVRRKDGNGYLLAIECDGPSYAAQRTARDRDKLRDSVLKSLGWHTTRLWSVDWALNRKRAEESLLDLLKAIDGSDPRKTA